jgi:hypothetical protein
MPDDKSSGIVENFSSGLFAALGATGGVAAAFGAGGGVLAAAAVAG